METVSTIAAKILWGTLKDTAKTAGQHWVEMILAIVPSSFGICALIPSESLLECFLWTSLAVTFAILAVIFLYYLLKNSSKLTDNIDHDLKNRLAGFPVFVLIALITIFILFGRKVQQIVSPELFYTATSLPVTATITTTPTPHRIYVQTSSLPVHRAPGSESSVIGKVVMCDELVRTGYQFALDNEAWLEVILMDGQMKGWINENSISDSLGVCPTFTSTPTETLTPSITPTPTFTLTPTWTPTLTPTPTDKEEVMALVLTYFEHINNGELDEAWQLLHPAYQAIRIEEEWQTYVTANALEVHISDLDTYVRTSGNTATIFAEYFETPNEQPTTQYYATFCLVYNTNLEKWFIRNIHLESGDYAACEF